MFSFFVQLIKLLNNIRHGLKEDPEFRALMFTLFVLLGSGTLFYWQVEGWSIVDSLYFSVMTMSTIGYGDFVPTTTLSKLFTIIFALMSIGVFVAVVSKMVSIILKQKSRTYEKLKNYSATRRHNGESAQEKDKASKKEDKEP